MRQTFGVTLLTRNLTNSIPCLKLHTNRINPFLPLIPEGSVVLADPEFDVIENYENADRVMLVVKQRICPGWRKNPARKRALKLFDKKLYNRRKLGERVFGNIWSRKTILHYREKETRHKGSLLVACAHNIQAYFACKVRSELFIKL